MTDYIPVNTPMLSGNEKKYLNVCIDTGWVSSGGPFIGEFEDKFSMYVDRKHGAAVANGSAALDIAVASLDLKEGDEVIMPAFTIVSCALSVIRAKGTPVLVDSDEDTWNMDVSKIEEKITPKTKAIMVVHIYGMPVDMDPVIDLADKYNLYIIEDAAEAHGQTYKGKKCGSFGDISTFSFYPNKMITTGEGGMVLTDNDDLAIRHKSLRNLCFSEERYVHQEMGWNYRMTNMQAALGVAQLENIDLHIKRKREIGEIYNKELSKMRGIKLPIKETGYAKNIYWVYGIVLKNFLKADSKEMRIMLDEKRIGTRPFFFPMHLQPVFKKMGLFKGEDYPVAEKLYARGLYVPSGLGINNEEIGRVVAEVKNLIIKG